MATEWEAARAQLLEEQGSAVKKSICQKFRPFFAVDQKDDRVAPLADSIFSKALEKATQQCIQQPVSKDGAPADFKKLVFLFINQYTNHMILQLLFKQKVDYLLGQEKGLQTMMEQSTQMAPDTPEKKKTVEIIKAVVKFMKEWKSKQGSIQEKISKYSPQDLQNLTQKLTAVESQYKAWLTKQPQAPGPQTSGPQTSSPQTSGPQASADTVAVASDLLLQALKKQMREEPMACMRKLRDICRLLEQDYTSDLSEPLPTPVDPKPNLVQNVAESPPTLPPSSPVVMQSASACSPIQFPPMPSLVQPTLMSRLPQMQQQSMAQSSFPPMPQPSVQQGQPSMPQSMPQSMQQSISQSMPQTLTQAMQQPMPQKQQSLPQMQQSLSQSLPQSMPQSMSQAMPPMPQTMTQPSMPQVSSAFPQQSQSPMQPDLAQFLQSGLPNSFSSQLPLPGFSMPPGGMNMFGPGANFSGLPMGSPALLQSLGNNMQMPQGQGLQMNPMNPDLMQLNMSMPFMFPPPGGSGKGSS